MSIILFDNKYRNRFYPLASTRAIATLRTGIMTIKERWELATRQPVFILTENYLASLYESIQEGNHFWIDSNVLINKELLQAMDSLKTNEAIADNEGLIIGRSDMAVSSFDVDNPLQGFANIANTIQVNRLQYPHQIFQWNDSFIRKDFELMTHNRISQPIPPTNNVINPSAVFLEEGVSMEFCTLNASTGPIYIGKGATLMEGCLVRGPFVLGDNSVLKMGSKIYGATTLGPNCVGGGEIKNVVMLANSNKAHDGYLGDSIIGEWCNFGAGTSNSNVKNTGGEVHLWNQEANNFVGVGQKCGLIMGDYSRAAINSSINTGTVIGVCCNVFCNGLTKKVIPDFSWGATDKYVFEKALADINNWKKMKHQSLSTAEKEVLGHLYSKLG